MSKITFRFSLSEVWSPKKGMNSFWGKHNNSSKVSFFIVWSTPFRGMTTLSLDFCWFLVPFEKFTIENSSTIHSFWIFRQKKSRNLMSGVWRFLNPFFNSGPVWPLELSQDGCKTVGRIPTYPGKKKRMEPCSRDNVTNSQVKSDRTQCSYLWGIMFPIFGL